MSIASISVESLREIITIKEQITVLEQKLAALLGGKAATKVSKAGRKPGRKKMSPEGRAKIIAAQKARWSKVKSAKAEAPAKAEKPAKKKRTISPEHRAKLRAMMKARWAAKKKK